MVVANVISKIVSRLPPVFKVCLLLLATQITMNMAVVINNGIPTPTTIPALKKSLLMTMNHRNCADFTLL